MRVRVKRTEDNSRRERERLQAAVAAGIKAAVPYIVRDAQRRAPVRSGDLRPSIVARQAGPATWLIRAEAHYAHIVESGGRHVAPRPFLRPALLAQRGTIGKRIHEEHRRYG